MVLSVEVVDAAFGTAFKEFLDAGGYQARERSTGEKEFYRFHKPSDQGFPFATTGTFADGDEGCGAGYRALLMIIVEFSMACWMCGAYGPARDRGPTYRPKLC